MRYHDPHDLKKASMILNVDGPSSKATKIQESIGNGHFEEVALELLDPFRYVQHNPSIPSGRAAILALHDRLPAETTRARVVRAFEDGDYGFVHVDYHLGVPIVAFDVHLFKDGRSVEHWDNLQSRAALPNMSGRTMIDGDATVTDRNRTLENKLLVTRYVEDVLIRGRLEEATRYFDGMQLLQHSPRLKRDGIEPLLASVRDGVRLFDLSRGTPDENEALLRNAQLGCRYTALRKVLGEGNFVLAICEAHVDGVHCAIYDLYRVSGCKIVEHWDVIEPIPPILEWKNFNGKF